METTPTLAAPDGRGTCTLDYRFCSIISRVTMTLPWSQMSHRRTIWAGRSRPVAIGPHFRSISVPAGGRAVLRVTVDVAELSRRLRIPVVPTQANRKLGVDDLKAALLEVERAPDDAEKINDLFRPFHTIKGMAGNLLANEVQALATSLEERLDTDDAIDIQRVDELANALQQLLETAANRFGE